MPSFLWSESVVEECAEKSTLHADARFAYLVLIVVELPEEDCRKEGGFFFNRLPVLIVPFECVSAYYIFF